MAVKKQRSFLLKDIHPFYLRRLLSRIAQRFDNDVDWRNCSICNSCHYFNLRKMDSRARTYYYLVVTRHSDVRNFNFSLEIPTSLIYRVNFFAIVSAHRRRFSGRWPIIVESWFLPGRFPRHTVHRVQRCQRTLPLLQ